MKVKTSSNALNIERGSNVHSDNTSVGLESLWDYVPCIIEQEDDTASDVEVTRTEKVSTSPSIATPSPLKLAQSESFFDDSKPPPMTIAVSTSETDEDDDDNIHNITKEQLLTDPFAPREGRTLCWRNVNMTLVRFLILYTQQFLCYIK